MSDTDNQNLTELLRRADIWRGKSNAPHSRLEQPSWDTGYPAFNLALRYQGWPLGQLIEACQPQQPYAEWLLWGPAIARCTQQQRIAVLVNPPAIPLLSGLERLGLDPTYLWIIQAQARKDFLPTLQELIHANSICALLAWEPKHSLAYTELRKLQLNCSQNALACCLFRASKQKMQSSPAALRLALQLQKQTLNVEVFKQKGHLQHQQVSLPLPSLWHECWPQHKPTPMPEPNTQIKPKPRILTFPVGQSGSP